MYNKVDLDWMELLASQGFHHSLIRQRFTDETCRSAVSGIGDIMAHKASALIELVFWYSRKIIYEYKYWDKNRGRPDWKILWYL